MIWLKVRLFGVGVRKKFEERYLRKGFDEKITVLRILDSRREKFKLSKAYAPKIDVNQAYQWLSQSVNAVKAESAAATIFYFLQNVFG